MSRRTLRRGNARGTREIGSDSTIDPDQEPVLMLVLPLLLALTVSGDVELSLADGTTLSGQLESLSTDQVTLLQNGQRRDVAANQLRRVRFSAAEPSAVVPLQATLTDGSRLTITTFQQQGDTMTLGLGDDAAPFSLSRRDVHAVRLMALEGELLEEWTKIVQAPPAADVVVVRHSSGGLRQVEGVVGDVNDAVVKFQLGGEPIDVRRERVAGLIFARVAQPQQGVPRGQVSLLDGTVFQVIELEQAGDQIRLTTPNGTRLTAPLNQLRHVDFAALSTVYLSDLEAESREVAPYLQVPALREIDQRWFEPQRDRRLSRAPLSASVRGETKSYEKGLGLHSRTELVYRLAGEYRRFLAVAALDEGQGPGQLTLIISTDGQEVYRQTLAAGDPAHEIDVDLSGANRLQIIVDYGDQNDQGDQLSLCDARLIK